jgi:hypothetical protein
MENVMQQKLWLAIAAAGLAAAPLVVEAGALDNGNIVMAQAGGGGADASSSVTAPGSNPPGSISPGAPSSAATGADVQSGAYGRTNPGTDDPDRLHSRNRNRERDRGVSSSGNTTR